MPSVMKLLTNKIGILIQEQRMGLQEMRQITSSLAKTKALANNTLVKTRIFALKIKKIPYGKFASLFLTILAMTF